MIKTAASIFITLAGVAGQPGPTSPTVKAPQSATPAIVVKEVAPARLIYLEHRGPYWAVGASLAEVREYMSAHNLDGTMFVRFSANPMTTPATTLMAQVGVMLSPEGPASHDPQPPFKTGSREREVVAFRILDPGAAAKRRDYDALSEWVTGHGQRAAGPVTEVFEMSSPGGDSGAGRTELQFTLALVGSSTAAVAPPPTTPETRSRTATTPSPSPPVQASPAAVETQSVVPTDTEHTASSTPISSPDPDDMAADIVHDAPVTGHPWVEPPPSAGPAPGRTNDDLSPIADLILAEDFDRIARQLMPGDCAVHPSFQIWLSQVVFRLGAAAKGVKQMYPDQERLIAGAAAAITRRYKSMSAGFELDPLGHAVSRIDVPTHDPVAEQRRAVMRDLDRFLGRIAFRSIDAGNLLTEFAALLERGQDLMRAHGCDTSPLGTATVNP